MSTKASKKSATSIAPLEAEKAYSYKLQGKSLSWIVDHTVFENTSQAHNAIKAYMMTLSSYVNEDERKEHLAMEVARIDAVQDEMWTIMKTAEAPKDAIAAAKAVLQASKQRSELTGLTQIDPITAGAQVIIISGAETDYIKALQATL